MQALGAMARLSALRSSQAFVPSGLRGLAVARPSVGLRQPPPRSRQLVPTRALLKPANGWKPTWSQTAAEVTICVPIHEGVSRKDINLEIHTKRLKLCIADETVLEGPYGQGEEDELDSLGQRVDPDGCFWSIEADSETERFIQINLEKKIMGHDSWTKLLPDDGPDMTVTDYVYMDVKSGEEDLGQLVFGLHGKIAPLTVKNFVALCGGYKVSGEGGEEKELTYSGAPFHRIIPRFMAQGGDISMGDGTGSVSIYGEKFDDENFVLQHDQAGVLSMANAGPNTNGSQFFLLFEPQPHLDGKHTVFGRLIDDGSMKVLRKLEDLGTKSGAPKEAVYISECGVLDASKIPEDPMA